MDRQLAECLHAVAVDERPRVFCPNKARGPLHRKNRARLIVDIHHTDKRRLSIHRVRDRACVDLPMRIRADAYNVPALALQAPHRARNRRMLGGCRDNPFSQPRTRAGGSEYGQIVCLASARGEVHAFRLAAKQRRDGLARPGHLLGGVRAQSMQRRRIPIAVAHHCDRRHQRFVTDARCRRVVKICRHLLHKTSSRCARPKRLPFQNFLGALTRFLPSLFRLAFPLSDLLYNKMTLFSTDIHHSHKK